MRSRVQIPAPQPRFTKGAPAAPFLLTDPDSTPRRRQAFGYYLRRGSESTLSRPLKKVHLPSAGPRVSLRSDAIDLCYAEPKIRFKLLARRIGPSRYPQAGGCDSCARPPRSDVLLKYACVRRFLARLASGTFLTGLKTGFFNTLSEYSPQLPLVWMAVV